MHLPTRKAGAPTGYLRRISLSVGAGAMVLSFHGASGGMRISSESHNTLVSPGNSVGVAQRSTSDLVSHGTRNRGRWRIIRVGRGEMTGVSCPSTRACYVTGGSGNSASTWRTTILATKDAGASWHTTIIQPARVPLLRIVCPGVRVCYTVGVIESEGARPPAGTSNDIVATRDGGQTWQVLLTSDIARIGAGACRALSSGCVYVGNISCPTVTTCYAPGFGPSSAHGKRGLSSILVTTSDGGRSWRQHSIDVISGTAAMSCPSVTTCYMLGGVNAITTDRGLSWKKRSGGPTGNVYSITCPAVRICYAVGFRSATRATVDTGTIAVTRDGGASWHTFLFTDAMPEGIACARSTICYAAGERMGGSGPAILVTRNGGKSWGREEVPSTSFDYPRAISCPGPNICYAVAGRGIIYVRD